MINMEGPPRGWSWQIFSRDCILRRACDRVWVKILRINEQQISRWLTVNCQLRYIEIAMLNLLWYNLHIIYFAHRNFRCNSTTPSAVPTSTALPVTKSSEQAPTAAPLSGGNQWAAGTFSYRIPCLDYTSFLLKSVALYVASFQAFTAENSI